MAPAVFHLYGNICDLRLIRSKISSNVTHAVFFFLCGEKYGKDG